MSMVSSSVVIPLNPTFILGNPSGDLDSTVSALALASLSPTAVPVMNYNRDELRLKPDVTRCLTELNLIDCEGVCFLDDFASYLSSLPPSSPPPYSVTLVDHNAVSFTSYVPPPSLHPRVTSIIDHHSDAGQHLQASPRVIKTTGSCATLVWDDAMGPTIRRALAVAILVDTGM
eukprot:CAMPEP_0182486152 /NCGR_PEP_ID=MMETSP1319-20130603/46520_1 /TAXON_ID=172717 /ORGANISM="Bolidomonas pacifica, Strain RCC208" /LENGTH=173 /DNA_ID=CAMNT_0024688211 /DNA_START=223 /DNA_END=741 /DNA_ORIENTATION=+